MYSLCVKKNVLRMRMQKGGPMPYMKYKNWYIPNCEIAFPTEEEAWEYLEDFYE